jgi:hypothetical protein
MTLARLITWPACPLLAATGIALIAYARHLRKEYTP